MPIPPITECHLLAVMGGVVNGVGTKVAMAGRKEND